VGRASDEPWSYGPHEPPGTDGPFFQGWWVRRHELPLVVCALAHIAFSAKAVQRFLISYAMSTHPHTGCTRNPYWLHVRTTAHASGTPVLPSSLPAAAGAQEAVALVSHSSSTSPRAIARAGPPPRARCWT
jgi:hypothetical protein